MLDTLESKSRKILKEALNKCTPEQIDLFTRMHGNVNRIPYDKVAWAYEQIARTIKSNEEK